MRPINIQRGNILFLILLAIVLFVALSYAVTQSTGGGAKNASAESAKTKVASILQWFDALDAAVLRMKVTEGIKPENMSFEYVLTRTDGTINNSYNINPNCSSDTCRVFKPAGGNIPPIWFKSAAQPDPQPWVSTYPAPGFYDFWIIQWPYAGTDANDISVRIMALDPAICTELNAALGITTTPTITGAATQATNPANWDTASFTMTTNASQMLGKSTLGQTSGNFCQVWHLLIIR